MRSFLYVPAGAPERLRRSLEHGADAVVVDLAALGVGDLGEALDDRGPARAAVAAWLPTVPAGTAVWLRVGPDTVGHEDLRAIGATGLSGVVARTESTVQLDALDAVLAAAEAEAGLAARALGVIPVLESASAIVGAAAIARAPRVVRLQLGEADVSQELGIECSDDERELLLLRSQVVLASAAAGIDAPIGAVFPDVSHPERLRRSTVALKRLGFRARACLDPAQITVVNQAFRGVPAEPFQLALTD